MKRETYHKDNSEIEITEKQSKKIIIFIEANQYKDLMEDNAKYRAYLNELIARYPELFPDSVVQGNWRFCGFTEASAKQGIRMRRISTTDNEVWQLHPSFVFPYMTCKTQDARTYLFLSRWCPPWALAYAFGRDAMFYYRLSTHFGSYSLVGSSVKSAEKLPKDLISDEKHTTISGEKVYASITCAGDCFLGASVSPSASEEDLTQAYGQFKKEATALNPEYIPQTVNTDGWAATRNAWKNLFATITVIQCFLHSVLKIKDAATNATKELYKILVDKAWEVYHAKTKRSFSQRIRRFNTYLSTLTDSKLKTAALKLCSKRNFFTPAYDNPDAHRTSNMVDRLINRIDLRLRIGKRWHGSLCSAQKGLRAFCLLQNFEPYCPSVQKKHDGKTSAFERLNGYRYSENWAENLLIATSIQKKYIFNRKR